MPRTWKLLSPCTIGPVKVKNRIALAALHTSFAMDGHIGARALAFYERRARGGAGLIMVGVANSEPPRLQGQYYDFSDDQAIPSYHDLVEAVHARGARVGIQLTPLPFYGLQPVKPPAERLAPLISHLAEATARACRAGFDLVELMANGGSLTSHLLSPVHNTWSIPGHSEGSDERMRFVLEAVAAMREAAGAQMALCVRIHGHEYLNGGYGLEQACLHAQGMVEAGAQAINVTGGGHTTTVPQVTGCVPRGAYAYLARAVRQAVSVPVFASNRICDPHQAEEILLRGDADLVNMPRSLVADPDLPLKVAQGEADAIRSCIACARCMDDAFENQMLTCTVRPRVAREHEPLPAPFGGDPRALVVGGGPAGCEAALALAERGARVTLFEARDRLGGKLHAGCAPPGRAELATLIRHYEHALPVAGVSVQLGEAVTQRTLAQASADILVLAAGSRPKRPEIDGIDRANVVLAEDVLTGEAEVGSSAVVIGAGGVGVEVAQYVATSWTIDPATQAFLVRTGAATPAEAAALALKGKPVTLCSRRLGVGRGLGRATRWTIRRHLEQLGVCFMQGVEFLQVTAEGLRVRHPDGREACVRAQTVIVATGYQPEPDLLSSFAGCTPRVLLVGDARSCGNLKQAIHDARHQVEALQV